MTKPPSTAHPPPRPPAVKDPALTSVALRASRRHLSPTATAAKVPGAIRVRRGPRPARPVRAAPNREPQDKVHARRPRRSCRENDPSEGSRGGRPARWTMGLDPSSRAAVRRCHGRERDSAPAHLTAKEGRGAAVPTVKRGSADSRRPPRYPETSPVGRGSAATQPQGEGREVGALLT